MASIGTYATLDNKNLIGLFQQMYDGALNAAWSSSVAMKIGSDSETEDYGWLGAAPSLTELKGEAFAEEGFKQFAYALKNKEYARSILLRDKDLRRDRLGQLMPRVQEMAQKAAEHWDTLTASAITTNGNAYDGVAFFATTHAESGSNQVNALSASHITDLNVSTAASPTIAEMAAILPQALGWFHTYTDDKGDPINGNARNFTIICGTVPIYAAINGALTVDNLTSGASNPVRGFLGNGYKVTALLTPRLSASTTAFWLFNTDSVVKPFIHQEEVPISPEMTSETSDEWVKYRRRIFSIYTSRAVGYGRWQSAIQCTLS